MSDNQHIAIILMGFWIWNVLLTIHVYRQRRTLRLASKRIALGLSPFPKAPDDGRDNYLDRIGIH